MDSGTAFRESFSFPIIVLDGMDILVIDNECEWRDRVEPDDALDPLLEFFDGEGRELKGVPTSDPGIVRVAVIGEPEPERLRTRLAELCPTWCDLSPDQVANLTLAKTIDLLREASAPLEPRPVWRRLLNFNSRLTETCNRRGRSRRAPRPGDDS